MGPENNLKTYQTNPISYGMPTYVKHSMRKETAKLTIYNKGQVTSRAISEL